ncbi:MAG: hypothetical protein AAGD13_16920 [Pseudomonadota bacterium]
MISGFSTRWLPSDSETVLKLPPLQDRYRYLGYWTKDSVFEELLRQLENVEDSSNTTRIEQIESQLRNALKQRQITESLDADGNSLFQIRAPESSEAGDYHYVLVAYDDDQTLKFASRVSAKVVSAQAGMIAGIIAAVVCFVWLLVLPRFTKKRLFEGADGRMSLANIQIAWFSAIVLVTMAYVVTRTGELGELSNDVLLLLGITAAGSAAAKVGDGLSLHLKSENRLLLITAGWLPDEQKYEFSQLFRDPGGRTDVSRVQAFGFSLIVGGYLFITGLTGLADVDLPDGILALLGLSQATYVGMKAASAQMFGDFNKHMTDLTQSLDGISPQRIKKIFTNIASAQDYPAAVGNVTTAADIKELIDSKVSKAEIHFKDVYNEWPQGGPRFQ